MVSDAGTGGVYRGSPRRRSLGVDVSPHRVSVDPQFPRHPSNGHPLKLGLLHLPPSLLLQERRPPRRCDYPQPGYVRIVDCRSVSTFSLIWLCAQQIESCNRRFRREFGVGMVAAGEVSLRLRRDAGLGGASWEAMMRPSCCRDNRPSKPLQHHDNCGG